jgi:hypothetical protein
MIDDDDRTYLCAGCGGLGRRAEMYSDDPPVCSWGCAAEAFEIDDLARDDDNLNESET